MHDPIGARDLCSSSKVGRINEVNKTMHAPFFKLLNEMCLFFRSYTLNCLDFFTHSFKNKKKDIYDLWCIVKVCSV